MSGEQYRLAAPDESANLRPHQAARFHVESTRGLVQKKQVGITAECDAEQHALLLAAGKFAVGTLLDVFQPRDLQRLCDGQRRRIVDRKSTRLNSSHLGISYAVFCLKKK